MGITYAWNWTDSHNKSLHQYSNFWLVILALATTGYLAALSNRVPIAAALVAFGVVLAALTFLRFIPQLQRGLNISEQALVELEKVVADELQIEQLRIAIRQRTNADRRYATFISYAIPIIATVAWSAAAIYALTRI